MNKEVKKKDILLGNYSRAYSKTNDGYREECYHWIHDSHFQKLEGDIEPKGRQISDIHRQNKKIYNS